MRSIQILILGFFFLGLTACAPSGGGGSSNDLNSVLRNKSSQIRSVAYFNGDYPNPNGGLDWYYDGVFRFDDRHLGARTQDEFCFKSMTLSDAHLQQLQRLISGLDVATYDAVPLILTGSESVTITFMDRSEVTIHLASSGVTIGENIAINGAELSLFLKSTIDNSPLLCQ